MRTLTLLRLVVPVMLLAGCVLPSPLPPTPAAPPQAATPPAQGGAATAPSASPPAAGTTAPAAQVYPPAAGGVPADWQTYANSDIGFSIRYPPNWTATPMTVAMGGGEVLEGPEGQIQLMWDGGFGGACAGYSAIHAGQGNLATCYSVAADGKKTWNGGGKELPAHAFDSISLTKDGSQASAELVLDVFATLTFAAVPASTPVAAAAPAAGTEVVVDNEDAAFWPVGTWYILSPYEHKAAQNYGTDCYQALPGLGATGEVRPGDLPAGAYEVFARWCGDPGATNASTHGAIEVHRSTNDTAPQAVGVNYQAGVGQWQSLGTYNLQPGAYLSVKSGVDGAVTADAYRFVYRSPTAAEAPGQPPASPTPIVTHNPPTPLQQLTSGDLAARLALVDPFYVSLPMTATQQTFDDCQAFPRTGCGGTRDGWQAMVTYQAITQVYEPISLTYRVSSDYKLVGITGLDRINPQGALLDTTQRQLVYLRGSGRSSSYGVYSYPDRTWHVLRPGTDTTLPSDVLLPADQGAVLMNLAMKYSTLYLQTADGGSLTFYGLGQTVAPSAEDKDALLAIGATVAGGG